ncbi:cache domain-containing protein [Sphaerotilus uruguayifluvii]|uniref:Two-component system NarL family sensor kinase n=1 Tax=Sphaerotilus uruguayifluvii TaxID=2735897 RepID=A0ABX2G4L1_9BURK|nr:cache domain-containing protein [Leptothrix sp. C29]NRT57214.1 two-component system NarL family sensor kinase [Leptothrix sp. C29]
MPAATAPEPHGPRRLRRRILLLAVLPLLAAIALIALAVRSQAQDLAREERQLVESAYLASKEAELRHHVEMAMNMVRPLYDSGRDDAATQAEAARILAAFDYDGGDGYFFVYDYSGRCLVLPHQPELVGQNLWDIRDRDGLPVVQELVARARQGQGYFRYVWNKPSSRQVAPKLGYVVGLQRWGWMVGTGIYLDDVQATLDALEREGRANIDKTTGWIAGIALLALVLVGGSALAMNLSEYRAADAQLQLLARQVVQSQENERAHLSRELHDGTGQTLVSIKLLMDSTMEQLRREHGRVPGSLERARRRIDEALGEVRDISHRLRPVVLDTLGLPSALRHLGEEFAEHAQLAFFMRIGGLEQDLPEAVNTVLFRITQEALTNIDKHAGAGRVDLRLIYRGGDVRLTVSDDGHGFDTAAIRADPRRGIGLLNMRERIESIGGEFRVQSRPGATRVVAQIGADAIRRLTPPPAQPAPSAVSAASLPSPTDVRRPDANPDRR